MMFACQRALRIVQERQRWRVQGSDGSVADVRELLRRLCVYLHVGAGQRSCTRTDSQGVALGLLRQGVADHALQQQAGMAVDRDFAVASAHPHAESSGLHEGVPFHIDLGRVVVGFEDLDHQVVVWPVVDPRAAAGGDGLAEILERRHGVTFFVVP